MAKAKRKEQTPMDKLTQGYENFIKDKQIKENGRQLFEKAIKKAAKIKQRGAK